MSTLAFLWHFLAIFIIASCALPSLPSRIHDHRSSPSLPSTIIHELPKGTWLENLVIRQTEGNALVTLLSSPRSCLGIVELYHDIFNIVAGNFSVKAGSSTPGSYSIWEIDMRNRDAVTTKIADIPGSGFLNGMTVLDPVTGILLVADSLLSVVWSVNVRTGHVAVALNDTTMAPTTDGTISLGINGLRVVDSNLYYDNSNKATFNRIPVDLHTGQATGPAVTLFQGSSAEILPDDFAIDFEGNAWVVTGGQMFLLPGATGSQSIGMEFVAGSVTETRITGWTSTKFGTRQADVERGSVYVTTDGGPLAYRDGNFTAGGMLVRIDTADLKLY
ncbi:uncharacterized protein PAC_19470 [Phialocephala subalpina]|uniref:SMP-30/Gluconolactonase/LRE-like region domain-containing protein n=1 Tax=Phialocephala subalpina TaxID=576137 RepID=A0A1L7XX48_9HELO|nr:uncharacterized protein PAC_19470 [Phialocephala subalpina]